MNTLTETEPPGIPPASPSGDSRSEAERRHTRPKGGGLWWLLLGLGLLLAAQHGNPDIGPAAWIYGLALLRFTRVTSLAKGLLGLLVVHAVAGAVWVVSIRLASDGLPWEAMVGAAVLSSALVIPFVLDRVIARRLRDRHLVLSTLVYPTARVGVELLIAMFSPFGIVFGFLASTQHEALPLLQVASITGLYGVSFLVAWAAPVGVEVWSSSRRWRAAVPFVSAVVAVALAGSFALWASPPSAQTVRVAGITPSPGVEAPVDELPGAAEVAAGDSAELDSVMEPVTRELLERTEREAAAGAEVIIWSEAATRVFDDDVRNLYERVGDVARRYGVHVLATAALYTSEPPHGRNIATMIGPDGSVLWEYDKTHPLAGLEPIEPGSGPVPHTDTDVGTLASMICYDLDYETARVPADILLLPAADWEGFDRQHTQKSKLRAVEQGYSVLRQDAHGMAAAYDFQGRTLGAVDYSSTSRQTLVAELPTVGRTTVYSVIGDVFAWVCIGVLAVLAVLTGRGGADPTARGRTGDRKARGSR